MNLRGNQFHPRGVSAFMNGCAQARDWINGTVLRIATALVFLSLFFTPRLASAQVQVTTSQYDNARTGANLKEKILTPQNVNSKRFGKLFSLLVDGDIYTQPLYLSDLEIPGKGSRNVLFVATEHDTVYAFDADTRGAPLWHASFLNQEKGITTLEELDVACPFIRPEIGITSTPVIDPSTGTLYVLARTKQRNSGRWIFHQKLHALDVATGAEKFGGPVEIRASVKETNNPASQGRIEFDPLRENQRAALLLSNGKIYIAWASSCDVRPYYGWVMAYDAKSLAQLGVLNLSPGAEESGVWQADAGPAADARGNVYVITGNGKFTAASSGRDFGDSVVKLGFGAHGLDVRDYFTPANQEKLNATDGDFGSGAPLLLPDQPGLHPHLLLAAGKAGLIYALDRDNLGKFHKGDDSNAAQVVVAEKTSMGAPAYWNGHIYYALQEAPVRDYKLEKGLLPKAPVAVSGVQIDDPGSPAVSADGEKNAIVWLISRKGEGERDQNAILFAFDGKNIAHQLYNSSENYARDHAWRALRFTIPTVANGRVYIGCKHEVDVYGLLSSQKSKN
jgi:hypothetical protein